MFCPRATDEVAVSLMTRLAALGLTEPTVNVVEPVPLPGVALPALEVTVAEFVIVEPAADVFGLTSMVIVSVAPGAMVPRKKVTRPFDCVTVLPAGFSTVRNSKPGGRASISTVSGELLVALVFFTVMRNPNAWPGAGVMLGPPMVTTRLGA